jgi:hypothetical protein
MTDILLFKVVIKDKPAVGDFTAENMWIFPFCQGQGKADQAQPEIDSKVVTLSDHRRGTDNWFILKGIENQGEPNPEPPTEWEATGKSLIRIDGSR